MALIWYLFAGIHVARQNIFASGRSRMCCKRPVARGWYALVGDVLFVALDSYAEGGILRRLRTYSCQTDSRRARASAPGFALATAAVALLAAGTLGTGCTREGAAEPPTPTPASLEAMDPEVRALIEGSVASVRECPRDAARWMRLGMAYQAHALTDPARTCYSHAVATDGSDARWWYHLAIAQEQLGDVAGALQSLERVTERSRYGPAHWRQGVLLFDQADLERSLTAFKRAAELDPADPTPQVGMARIALQKREPEQAIEIIQKLISRPEPLLVSTVRYAWHLLSAAYRQSGRFDEARSLTSLASVAEPVRHDPWADEILEYRRGYLWVLKEARERVVAGQLETALLLLERLHRDRPNDIALMNELATVYSGAGRPEEALAILALALAADPNRFETHANLASAHMGQGDLGRALTHADRAVQLNPRFAKAHEVRGAILWRAGRPIEALGGFEAAVRYEPTNVVALVSAGMIQGSMGRFDAALVHLQRAIELDPTHADALVGIAMVMMSLGRLDEADAALERAVLLQPAHSRVTATQRQLKGMRSHRR